MIRVSNLIFSLFLFVCSLFIFSCDKDEDNNDEAEQYEFSVQFVDGYGRDYGWVVLHNSDGTAVSEYKKYVGDALVDFGEVNSSNVTITCVMIDTFQTPFLTTGYSIDITSDYTSPAGKWIFTGDNQSKGSLGTADVTMHYPNNNYSGYIISHTSGTQSSSSVPQGEVYVTDYVYRLEENNKCSMFGAVYAEKGGLYGWLLDQEFQLNQTNEYDFELNQTLTNKTINANKPIGAARLQACWNQRNSRLYVNLTSNWYTSNDVEVCYPHDMPNSEWYLRLIASDPNGCGYAHYDKYYNKSSGLPDMVNIPDHTVTASYNESTNEINNIEISGTPDQICGYWTYSDMDDYYNWRIHSPTNKTTLKQPVLPDEVIQEIGDKIDMMFIYYVMITDYNTTNSHEDIINKFFIQNVPVYERYDERFYFTHYLDDPKSNNTDSSREQIDLTNYYNFDK